MLVMVVTICALADSWNALLALAVAFAVLFDAHCLLALAAELLLDVL